MLYEIQISNRRRVKAKTSDIKFAFGKTGCNGTKPIKMLDDLDKRLLSVITMEMVDGDGENEEFIGNTQLKTVRYQNNRH